MASDRRNASSLEQMKKKKTQQEEDEIEMNNDDDAGAVVDTSRSRDGLLYTLLRLKVCGPLFVLRKKLVRSYLSRNQNYLGITQTEYDGGFRRQGQRVLTDEEHGRVHAAGGLPLRPLDRRGVTYPVVLVHLAKTCRLRTGWGDFLRSSGVRQDDDTHVGNVVEIWAFRSPAWPTGLGLVLLHYTKKEDDAIITASLQQEEEEDAVTTSSDSDQEAQCINDQDDVDAKNCSPLGQGRQDGNCSPLEEEVVHAAAILISMMK